ncbi:flagellar hook-basal body complex protein FliE [Allohahella sp. A8]|jgi:flagellar hook-basal body complex protein FliE|uniref:flagellar hook-basal body complex protein FliE n=1 Tax=Allohahella sp. A8 TaxID=3141461 RepID=UPI000C0ABA59|nr:flagellar hook-basal body complex protein FliE [Hahellaceae bacterium]|tara:strand:+ start:64330 stop:64701 length:372 start_codon:yes stop_codon:yes gene_type:complete
MNNRIDVSNVLADIRNLRAQMQNPATMQANQIREIRPDTTTVNPTGKAEAAGFGQMFKQAIDGVNDMQQTSASMQTRWQQGDPNVDLTEVMIASQKASVGFQALTQVRNRVVQAYEDIMNMPV